MVLTVAGPLSTRTMTGVYDATLSPYTTLEPGMSVSASLDVCSIILRPVAVTEAAMGTHGIKPLVAPQYPYVLHTGTMSQWVVVAVVAP